MSSLIFCHECVAPRICVRFTLVWHFRWPSTWDRMCATLALAPNRAHVSRVHTTSLVSWCIPVLERVAFIIGACRACGACRAGAIPSAVDWRQDWAQYCVSKELISIVNNYYSIKKVSCACRCRGAFWWSSEWLSLLMRVVWMTCHVLSIEASKLKLYVFKVNWRNIYRKLVENL